MHYDLLRHQRGLRHYDNGDVTRVKSATQRSFKTMLLVQLLTEIADFYQCFRHLSCSINQQLSYITCHVSIANIRNKPKTFWIKIIFEGTFFQHKEKLKSHDSDGKLMIKIRIYLNFPVKINLIQLAFDSPTL